MSVFLLGLATIKFLINWMSGSNAPLGKVLRVQRPVKTIEIVNDPEEQGERIGRIIMDLKKGGHFMKDYITKMSKTQITALVVTLLGFVSGILIYLVPELAFLEEFLLEIFIGTGISGLTAGLALGKQSGEKVKEAMTKADFKKDLKSLNARKEKIVSRYSEIIELEKDIREFGGQMTQAQSVEWGNYQQQMQVVDSKIKEVEAKIAEK
jgi:hypothetical protein